ncbi:pyruvate decarboxylase PdcB [Chlamydoabsidia padenii]|nr:pyruvate decarboxylase PdcB [Chlamydoabsidia padenii]
MVLDTSETYQTITIGKYLFNRLKEIGIEILFGLPGDYNLQLLDLAEEDNDFTWAGNINELNAAYAADGYARVKGVGALITTFGVGELSAINGIAGSYAERIPVLHIVGTPKTNMVKRGMAVHHSLGDGDFSVFYDMYSRITVAKTILTVSSAADEIDRVIAECLRNRRPGYIGIPRDIVNTEINICKKKLDYSIPKNLPETQKAVLESILTTINRAKRPIILVDGCVRRYQMEAQVMALVQTSGFPVYATTMGLDSVNHTIPNFRGCFMGDLSLSQIKKEVAQADLIIEIGSIPFDVNRGGFTYHADRTKTITFHASKTQVLDCTFDKIAMQELLPCVTEQLKPKKELEWHLGPRAKRAQANPGNDMQLIYFWNKFIEYLPERSVVIAETGSASLGSYNMTLPHDGCLISQVGWESIGYALPAALGAALADWSRRVFLLVGDGSFQVSAQEIAPMLRLGVCPIIVLFNNDGYLIERLIHTKDAEYNDIHGWNYADTLNYFNASHAGVQRTITTRREFEQAMDQALSQPDRIHFLDVVFPKYEAFDEITELIRGCSQF